MNRGTNPNQNTQSSPRRESNEGRDIAWYHPGQSRSIEFGGVQVTVRFVARKGRRGRIAITATAGANYFEVTGQQASGCMTVPFAALFGRGNTEQRPLQRT